MQRDLSAYLFKSEKDCVQELIDGFDWDGARAYRVSHRAGDTIRAMRDVRRKPGSIESFFQTYGLNTQEGIALMCLAEALLRVPDAGNANALIQDKIGSAAWDAQGDRGDDWVLRMAGLGLSASRAALDGPMARLGAPVIRKAMIEAMKVLGGQFVLGQTMTEAIKNAAKLHKEKGYLFSYDMLGEGARTMDDADAYFESYAAAIAAAGSEARSIAQGLRPGISVKLSALHPRFSIAQEDRCVPELSRRLSDLCRLAAAAHIGLTVDAEESERLETTLKILNNAMRDMTLTGWNGLGLAVQAYGKRTPALIDNLIEMAQETGRRIQVRLVKGAYWDSEIKRAQMKGLDDYPVYTRKNHTDLAYLVCAQKLLRARDYIYPMFGTHNAHTVEAIIDMAGADKKGFEFQRLFGMGEALYDHIRAREDLPVRIYAPVGVHRDLLPYLVRRLLENGANSSFVNKVFDGAILPEDVVRDPLEAALQHKGSPHPSIRAPVRIFPDRGNSKGVDLDDAPSLQSLLVDMDRAYDAREVFCGCLIDGKLEKPGHSWEVRNPADRDDLICTAYAANAQAIDRAYMVAAKAQKGWDDLSATRRASVLNKIADLYEESMPLLMALIVREAGRTLPDALSEVREAVDFCRYYAAHGGKDFDQNGEVLRSYTGESNKIMLQGRGVFACISPWNFPIAIFTGQILAALMAGNAVLAKPAEQTPLCGFTAVQLMHRAGVPKEVLHLIAGDGRVGEILVQHETCAGVTFTGSGAAARSIARTLAAKDGPIVPLIAETGGLNAIIADSTALPEQVVDDVMLSAFGSAGQRCSAARVLFVQEEIADKVIGMLRDAMAELRLGDPQFYASDIGPVIDDEALAALHRHTAHLEGFGKLIAQAPLSDELRRRGHYFAPAAWEIQNFEDLRGEVFGPILHVIRFKGEKLSEIIQSLNRSFYGLTFGLHTRIDGRATQVARDIACGNVYINRSIIGAVVGVQPFGGQGLSGTGPKAGGPHYLQAFATEKTVSVNTAATGGNASLLMLEE